jgi:hypothetical protein
MDFSKVDSLSTCLEIIDGFKMLLLQLKIKIKRDVDKYLSA